MLSEEEQKRDGDLGVSGILGSEENVCQTVVSTIPLTTLTCTKSRDSEWANRRAQTFPPAVCDSPVCDSPVTSLRQEAEDSSVGSCLGNRLHFASYSLR